VPFKPVTVTNLDEGATSAAPQTMYEIARPLLNYPAAVYAGIPNAAAALLADLPAAGAAGREAGLPDPAATQLPIEVKVRQLAMDTAIFVPGGPMPSGLPNGEKSRVRQLYAEGKVGREARIRPGDSVVAFALE